MTSKTAPDGGDVKLIYRALRQIDFFADLSVSELDLLIDGLEREGFGSGRKITAEGRTGDCLYLVSKGSLTVWSDAGLLRKKLIGRLEEGMYFGEMALLGDQVRKATVVTDTRCELYALHRDKFWQILMNNPMIELKIKKLAVDREGARAGIRGAQPPSAGRFGWLGYRLRQLIAPRG